MSHYTTRNKKVNIVIIFPLGIHAEVPNVDCDDTEEILCQDNRAWPEDLETTLHIGCLLHITVGR